MKGMPHLAGALLMQSPVEGHGLCFHRAVGLVLDTPAAKLAIGILRAATPEERERLGDSASTVPFIHAWCEVGDKVYAPTTYERAGGKLVAFSASEYYRANGITAERVFPRAWVMKVAKANGLDRHLRKHDPLPEGVSFAMTILDAAEFPYRVDSEAVLPAGDEQ